MTINDFDKILIAFFKNWCDLGAFQTFVSVHWVHQQVMAMKKIIALEEHECPPIREFWK